MMRMLRTIWLIDFVFVSVILTSGAADVGTVPLRAADIGRMIFLDTGLSNPPGQGCISCHFPPAAFADPRRVSPGAVPGREGRRNAPSLMYAALIPGLAYEDILTPQGTEIFAWTGGLFHDGRAGDQFAQVQKPFLDSNEMNLGNESVLAVGLRKAGYAEDLRRWVGGDVWPDDRQLTYHVYRALVAFLREPMFRPFDARIDDYLNGDKGALTLAEKRGLKVFRDDGRCADCHLLTPDSWPKPLLSDFGYDNLGVPSRGVKDLGLGAQKGFEEMGKFRAPSLRNIELTAPYMHNGAIATLREVMEFYNKRDLEPGRWGATDYPETVNKEDMGDLGLTDQQVADLTELMAAFTDRTLLEMKKGQKFPAVRPGTPTSHEKRLAFPGWTHRLHPDFRETEEGKFE
jgi:cytochrome c peroxidase